MSFTARPSGFPENGERHPCRRAALAVPLGRDLAREPLTSTQGERRRRPLLTIHCRLHRRYSAPHPIQTSCAYVVAERAPAKLRDSRILARLLRLPPSASFLEIGSGQDSCESAFRKCAFEASKFSLARCPSRSAVSGATLFQLDARSIPF
jgi:hypothetical protein